MGMPLVIGVDSSTQSTKVEARVLQTGELIASGRASHPSTTPPVSEQDPQSWWDALVAACEELGSVRDDAVALAVGAQQHGLVLVDETGSAVRPAKLWNDTTSAANADALVAALGTETWAERCGSVPVAAFTAAKLHWVAEHEPQLIDRIAKIMLPHDWLTWRLTDQHVTDRGDASGTAWWSPHTDGWDPELLEVSVGRSDLLDRLPRVLGPHETAGELRQSAAVELGLPPGIAVGPGTGDNMAAGLGLGLRSGEVVISLGTSGTVYAASSTATADASGLVAGFAGADGGFLPLACTLNATGVTDTVGQWLGADPAALSDMALTVSVEDATGLVLVPYFDGERTPNLPDATGRYVGLTRTTTREELARAAHDGVLCGLLDGLDALRRAGASCDGPVRLIGGGARSGAYRQRAADLLGAAVCVPAADELVAAGAAVQAAGVYDADGGSFSDIAERWGLRDGDWVEPIGDGAPVRETYAHAAAQAAEFSLNSSD